MRAFQGWRVLWATFFNATLAAGAVIYALSLFVKPLEAEFGLSREQTNATIFMALYVAIAFWALMVGRVFEKISVKQLSIAGAIAILLGYLIFASAGAPIMISIAIALFLGFGLTAAGPFVANAMATRWFAERRGRALGIATVATSAGGFFVVPIFAVAIERFGWRMASVTMGAIVAALIVLVTWRFVINRPSDVGQFPDGADAVPKGEGDDDASAESGFVKTRSFWLIALGAGLLLGSDQALLASLIPYGQERGFGTERASLLLTAISGSAIAGKLLVGWLTEKYDKRLLFALVCTANILFLLAALSAPSYWRLFLVCSIVGMAIGGVYPVWTTLVAQHFGHKQFAKAIGAMNLITVPMIIISIQIAGRTHDDTGDYNLAFQIFIVQAILAAAFIWLTGPITRFEHKT